MKQYCYSMYDPLFKGFVIVEVNNQSTYSLDEARKYAKEAISKRYTVASKVLEIVDEGNLKVIERYGRKDY